jgi:hypothetical protein
MASIAIASHGLHRPYTLPFGRRTARGIADGASW